MATFNELAERFRRFYFDKPEPDSFSVWYQDNSSRGNRYINWKGIWAYRHEPENETVIDMDRLYRDISNGKCDWNHLFEGVHYGLIVGPRTLLSIETCIEILKNDSPPEDDGTKVKHVNYLGGVNMLSKPTFHDWELTDKIGKILSKAFFEDRASKELYSSDFHYVFKSHSGWSRSS